MDIFSLNDQLDTFRSILNTGRGNIVGDTVKLFQVIVAIEVAFAGIYLAIGGQGNGIEICRKILKVGTLFWLISNYSTILGWVYEGFLYTGVTVGGATAAAGPSVATLQNPDAILQLASNFLGRFWQYASTGGATNTLGLPTLTTLIIFILAIPTYLALGLMAINVFITYLEFLIISAVSVVLIPFALFKPFSWLFDRAQGAVVSLGIKSMILALVIAMADTILRTHPLATLLTASVDSATINEDLIMATVTYTNCAHFFLLSLTLLLLSFHAPSLALTLLGGGPQLTAGSIASAMRGTMHNLEGGRGLANQSLGMASSAVTRPVMATLGGAAKLGGGVRGGLQSLRAISASNNNSGSGETSGSKVSGIGQLAKAGMAGMYGAATATAGEAIVKAYQSTGGKFEKALEAQGNKGEALGRKAVLNASSLFGASKEKGDEKKSDSKNGDTKKGKETGNF